MFQSIFKAPLVGLLVTIVTGAIVPDYQSIIWESQGKSYWTPLTLNTTAYAFASPSGPAPYSLSKRSQSIPGLLPCTVITLNSTTPLTGETLNAIVDEYESIDDVWTRDFLESVFIQYNGTETELEVDPSFVEFFLTAGVEYAFLSTAFKASSLTVESSTSIFSTVSACDLRNGPYVASVSPCGLGMGLTPAYTLNVDAYEAFMSGSFPDTNLPDSFRTLHVSIPGTRLPAIITPSRLGKLTPGAGPLAGLRMAVKDIFHVTGLKTSGGSRAYYQSYGTQNYTTETVDLCLAAGAEMIGKTRTITFALGTPNNGQNVDILNPWSARGDGYQTTGGSSSGSGAAVADYEWVDFAIGSDTGGSVRFPARFGGFYGYKPTHGIFNITGILVAIAEQDTPGFMARSPKIFTALGEVWTKNKPLTAVPETFPTKILLQTDEAELVQPEAEALKQEFIANFTSFFNLTSSSISITDEFIAANISESSPPQNMSIYLANVYADQNSVQGWDKIGAPLTELYKSLNLGASPPAGDPPVNVSWTDGQNITTRERYPESQRRRVRFGDFFNQVVLPANEETCSESILVHSYHTPPGLTKVTPTPARLTPGWYNGVGQNYAGVPEIVVPIGQVQYFSPYTLINEWQPVTVAIGVAKGCDKLLFEIVDRLAEAGILKETLPGKVAYSI